MLLVMRLWEVPHVSFNPNTKINVLLLGDYGSELELGPWRAWLRRYSRDWEQKDSRAGELVLEVVWWSPRPAASLTVSMTAILGNWLLKMCDGD